MDEWWRSAVIYQIYPRSFQDSDGDGMGDLPGITRRLDHVASLGVDVVWLSPFFRSPMTDMGYDISDPTDVDPIFGTLVDFDALLARAHELGLRLIIDQVPGHTSHLHPWFEESRLSRDNPKSDWYVWADPKPDGTPPNNWLSVFGGPAWTWEPRRRQYFLHNFLVTQPQLNFHTPAVQDAVLENMRFWLDRGVDGFRLDSINYPFCDRLLRDNPPNRDATDEDWVNPYGAQLHLYDKTRPENVDFLRRVRRLMDEYPGTMTVGEVGEGKGAGPIMAAYTSGGDTLNMAYSFEMLSDDFDPAFFRQAIGGFFEAAPDGWACWAFSNHDVVRHVSRWEVAHRDTDALARLGIALMVSLQGTKCLYQGEELGQTETELEFHEIVDPPGLKFWPEYKGRDGCRTPMVWEESAPHAGFTTGTPWLPVKPAQAARAVDAQERNPASVLAHYREVLAFYRGDGAEALRTGGTEWIETGDAVLAFRRTGATPLLCLFNLGSETATVEVGDERLVGPTAASLDAGEVALPGFGWAWLAARE